MVEKILAKTIPYIDDFTRCTILTLISALICTIVIFIVGQVGKLGKGTICCITFLLFSWWSALFSS